MGAPGSTQRSARLGGTPRRRASFTVVGAVAFALAVLAAPSGAGAAPTAPSRPAESHRDTAHARQPGAGRQVRLRPAAKTDTSLLGQRSTAPVHVVVKLDYDSLAAYAGHIKGLPATSPSVTGKRAGPGAPAARRYEAYVEGVEQRFLGALRRRVPAAEVGDAAAHRLRRRRATLPGNQVAELLKLPGAAAVQRDRLEQPQTDSSPAFIGAPTVYNQLGETARTPARARSWGCWTPAPGPSTRPMSTTATCPRPRPRPTAPPAPATSATTR